MPPFRYGVPLNAIADASSSDVQAGRAPTELLSPGVVSGGAGSGAAAAAPAGAGPVPGAAGTDPADGGAPWVGGRAAPGKGRGTAWLLAHPVTSSETSRIRASGFRAG